MEAFPSLLLISSDPVLCEAIPAQLAHALGTKCETRTDLDESAKAIAKHPPAILMIDLAMEGASELAQELRQRLPLMGMVAIGTTQADAAEAESLASQPLTAYATRPLAMPALIRSLDHLAYSRNVTAGQQTLELTEGWAFLPAERQLTHPKAPACRLTDKETAILLSLYHHLGAALPRHILLEEVWGYSNDINTHTLETHLYRLRSKIREATGLDNIIQTAKDGYRLHIAR